MYEEPNNEKERESIQISLENFEGPLDLLLFLVNKNKIDIYDIPIAEITEKYLEYLQHCVEKNLNTLTAFHQMTSTLLLIKSSLLLPQSADGDYGEIEDTKTELIEKIIEYHRYKKLSYLLRDTLASSPALLLRNDTQSLPLADAKEPEWKELSSLSLLNSFLRSMEQMQLSQKTLNLHEEVTVQQKKTVIYELLEDDDHCTFSDVVGEGGVLAMICSFLAVLDLLYQQVISALQKEPFGIIYLRKRIAA